MNGDRALCRQANAFLNPLIVEMVFALACLCGARIAKLTTASAEIAFAYSKMVFAYSEIVFALACLCGARIAEITNASAEMVFAYSEMAFVPAEMAFAYSEATNAIAEIAFAPAKMAFAYPKVRFSLRLFPLQTIDLRFFRKIGGLYPTCLPTFKSGN